VRHVKRSWIVLNSCKRSPLGLAQTARDDPDPASAFTTLFDELDLAVQRALPRLGPPPGRDRWLERPATAALHYLMDLSARCPRPLVVMIDGADALVGQTMASSLTQLRRGYIDRSSTPFPWSVTLVGMRQVRDYLLSREEQEKVRWLGTTSPFNITAEAATLSSFTPEQVACLLGQHTGVTGQPFEAEAVALLGELSQGHLGNPLILQPFSAGN
jgi:hypothetical protein